MQRLQECSKRSSGYHYLARKSDATLTIFLALDNKSGQSKLEALQVKKAAKSSSNLQYKLISKLCFPDSCECNRVSVSNYRLVIKNVHFFLYIH